MSMMLLHNQHALYAHVDLMERAALRHGAAPRARHPQNLQLLDLLLQCVTVAPERLDQRARLLRRLAESTT